MKKKNKKKWLSTFVGGLLGFAVGAAGGLLMVKIADKTDSIRNGGMWTFVLNILIMLGAIYASMFLHILVHEGGHLVFGMLTGYKFNSFRIGSRILLKTEQGLRWKKLHIQGTAGQCLLDPPELINGRMPYVLYNLGGVLMNFLVSLICLVISLALWKPHPYGAECFLIIALMGCAFILLNGIPAVMGGMPNDGYNAWTIRKFPGALRAFRIQMQINQEVSRGRRLKELPEEWFQMPSDEDMQNPLSAAIGVFVCNRLMDEHRFEEADHQIEKLLHTENGIIDLHRKLLACDGILCQLLGERNEGVLDGLLDKEQLKFMKAFGKSLLSVTRTQYGLVLLKDQDTEKGEELRKRFEKQAKVYPYESDIQSERELMDQIDISFKEQTGQTIGPEKEITYETGSKRS